MPGIRPGVRPIEFNVRNWYWIVNGSTTQVFSSKTKGYVSVNDSTYKAWLAKGGRPTEIKNEAELFEMLAEKAPECLPSTTAANIARQERLISLLDKAELGRVVLTIAFKHENRIRVLEKKSEITVDQFKAALKEML